MKSKDGGDVNNAVWPFMLPKDEREESALDRLERADEIVHVRVEGAPVEAPRAERAPAHGKGGVLQIFTA